MICHLKPHTINHLHDAKYIKYLGSGTFGDIKLYKCKEKVNGCACNKIFVVKHIKSNKKNAKNIRKNLLNEYTIGTLLHHPCIRETLDIDLNKNCIIFEYVEGVDYLSVLKTNFKNINENIYYFKQLIEGIVYMHNIGIAHMDLKLENIMVDEINKKIKIIDFGEARVFHDSSHISSIIPNKGIHGSLPYIAPEEFYNIEYSPDKVDVWSCGIILYEIVYLVFPWRKAHINDSNYKQYLYNRSLNKIDKILPNVNCRKLIYLMLNPNPNERCTIKEVNSELNNIEISN